MKKMMMGRIVLAIVIGSMVAVIIFFAEVLFLEKEHPNRESLSRGYHPFSWERTICYTCHPSDESIIDYQAKADARDGIAQVRQRAGAEHAQQAAKGSIDNEEAENISKWVRNNVPRINNGPRKENKRND